MSLKKIILRCKYSTMKERNQTKKDQTFDFLTKDNIFQISILQSYINLKFRQ
jgi:hypothetical protein